LRIYYNFILFGQSCADLSGSGARKIESPRSRSPRLLGTAYSGVDKISWGQRV
jgi:hypothetical protein